MGKIVFDKNCPLSKEEQELLTNMVVYKPTNDELYLLNSKLEVCKNVANIKDTVVKHAIKNQIFNL